MEEIRVLRDFVEKTELKLTMERQRPQTPKTRERINLMQKILRDEENIIVEIQHMIDEGDRFPDQCNCDGTLLIPFFHQENQRMAQTLQKAIDRFGANDRHVLQKLGLRMERESTRVLRLENDKRNPLMWQTRWRVGTVEETAQDHVLLVGEHDSRQWNITYAFQTHCLLDHYGGFVSIRPKGNRQLEHSVGPLEDGVAEFCFLRVLMIHRFMELCRCIMSWVRSQTCTKATRENFPPFHEAFEAMASLQMRDQVPEQDTENRLLVQVRQSVLRVLKSCLTEEPSDSLVRQKVARTQDFLQQIEDNAFAIFSMEEFLHFLDPRLGS